MSNPNHSQWSQSEDGYGHKILSAQGWKPGSFLGARNANHAGSYTVANASHIRIAFKDDNLGLGAKLQSKATAHNDAGFDAFQGLLGRLNGKTDAQLATEQRKRDDLQLARYAQDRWKSVTFVYGGTLIQEKMPKTEGIRSLKTSTGDAVKESPASAQLSKMGRKTQKERQFATRRQRLPQDGESKAERCERKRRMIEESHMAAQTASTDTNQPSNEKVKRKKDRRPQKPGT